MDYTLSVYLPEISLSNTQGQITREELSKEVGLTKDVEGPLLLQLFKQRNAKSEQSKPVEEEKKQASKSPFAKGDNARQSNSAAKEDEIEEDIVQDHEDI